MNRAELIKRLWRLISVEGIIVTNDNLDWLLERVYKEHEAEQTAAGREMRRYIDVDALLTKLPNDLPYKASVKRVLMQAPAADVVEVTRCKDCRRWTPTDDYGIDLNGNKLQYGECSLMQHTFREDNYCCFGTTDDEFSCVNSCVTQQK